MVPMVTIIFSLFRFLAQTNMPHRLCLCAAADSMSELLWSRFGVCRARANTLHQLTRIIVSLLI